MNGISSNAAQITVMPFVFTASVASVNGSTLLTVSGRNFGTPATDGVFELLLDGQPLGTTRWEAQTLQALLPEKLSNGGHTIIVIAASLASNFFEFSITNSRLVGGFASSTTSPGNSWKRNAAHQALPGRLIIDTKPGTIHLPYNDAAISFQREFVSDPQLRGALIGLATTTIQKVLPYDSADDSYMIYFARSTGDIHGVYAMLGAVDSVVAVVPSLRVSPDWSEKFSYTDPGHTHNAAKFDAMRVPQANIVSRGSRSAWIAIVALGIAKADDLLSNWYQAPGSAELTTLGENDKDDHDTLVASVCCAARNNAGAVGVAPNARFAYFANRDATGAPASKDFNFDFNELMMGVYDAFNAKAPILNTSWSIALPKFTVETDAEPATTDFNRVKTYWQSRIKRWLDNPDLTTIWVTAIGNQNKKCNWITSPDTRKIAVDSLPGNADPRIITIGGDIACYFEGGGTWIDLSGPTGILGGAGVLAPWSGAANSTDDEDGLQQAFGTSFATPAVAGVVNLLKDWNPYLSRAEIETILKAKATFDRVVTSPHPAEQFGNGYVDAYASLLYAEKYYGQGELFVQEMEAQAELSELTDGEIPLQLAFTVKEGTTKTVTLHIDNPGDGVLYFTGWAYRCLAHSIFFGICTSFNEDIRFSPATMGANGYVTPGGSSIDEGYITPTTYNRSVDLTISGIGMQKGDKYDGTVYFWSDESHHDINHSFDFWMNIKVTVVGDDDCFTSQALVGTPLESEIPGLRKFRDDYMVPQRANGKKWANLYRTHGPEIVKGFDRDAPQVYVYRMLVDRFGPSLVAKGIKETGLSFLADAGALRKEITKDDIILAQSLLSALANANPTLADVGQRLSALAQDLEGMTAEEAIEYVTAQDPDRL